MKNLFTFLVLGLSFQSMVGGASVPSSLFQPWPVGHLAGGSTVAGEEEEPVFDIFTDRILAEIVPASLGSIDVNTERYLSQLTSDGGFPDVDYKATDRTNWPPLEHINRMMEMAKAYTFPESKYYGSTELKAALDRMLAYWHQQQPRSNNW